MSAIRRRVDYMKDGRCSKTQRTLNRLYNTFDKPVKYLTLMNRPCTRESRNFDSLNAQFTFDFPKTYSNIILKHFPLIALFDTFFNYFFDRLRNMKVTIKYRGNPFFLQFVPRIFVVSKHIVFHTKNIITSAIRALIFQTAKDIAPPVGGSPRLMVLWRRIKKPVHARNIRNTLCDDGGDWPWSTHEWRRKNGGKVTICRERAKSV